MNDSWQWLVDLLASIGAAALLAFVIWLGWFIFHRDEPPSTGDL